jgi:Binding-protein-dependent transport system inner membrane component
MRMSRMMMYWHVTVPSIIPYTVVGMKLAMVNSFGTVIIAEIVASDRGLGYLIGTGPVPLRRYRDPWAILEFLTDRVFRWISLALTGKYRARL